MFNSYSDFVWKGFEGNPPPKKNSPCLAMALTTANNDIYYFINKYN